MTVYKIEKIEVEDGTQYIQSLDIPACEIKDTDDISYTVPEVKTERIEQVAVPSLGGESKFIKLNVTGDLNENGFIQALNDFITSREYWRNKANINSLGEDFRFIASEINSLKSMIYKKVEKKTISDKFGEFWDNMFNMFNFLSGRTLEEEIRRLQLRQKKSEELFKMFIESLEEI